MAYTLIFLQKKCDLQKLLTFFQQKYLLDIALTRTVNILTTNELVIANAKATHFLSAKILVYMPYLIVKVLTICSLMIALVLSNWALVFRMCMVS